MRLVAIARAMLEDLRTSDPGQRPVVPASRLDEDLGLDSLSRMEFFARVEREFGVRLPDRVQHDAATLGDVLEALGSATPGIIERAPIRAAAPPADTATGTPAIPPPSVDTLDRLLAWHVERHPHRTHVTLLDDGQEQAITYARLLEESRAVAGGLQRLGIQAGEAVALMLPTSADYFYAFFGALLAGAFPVPLYPPARASQIEEHVRRHAGILRNCAAGVLVTAPEMRRTAHVLRIHAPALRRIATSQGLRAQRVTPVQVTTRADSIAMLQYTSGSTGQPKGVVLTHANILTNIDALGAALRVRENDRFVSWLPLYHDMGLIGAWLGSLYFGLPLYLMSPLAFLSRPVRWLEAIHRHGGTLTAAPNFAYELCLKRIEDVELQGLDLRTWRAALNGAEAVMPETLERFQERFEPYGLARSALMPVYGLAECSVGLSIPPLDRAPRIDTIDRERFVKTGAAIPADGASERVLRFVSCGVPIPGHKVRIVDEANRELPERREGRLEFQGPSATSGYFRNPQATAALLRGEWLDSGDRAYQAGGEIFVTGRTKDIVIRAGRHVYPEEIEAAVGKLAGIRKGCVAVFGAPDRASGTERLVVMAETRTATHGNERTLRDAVVRQTAGVIGEPPDDVALVPPHTVLKTSSGKIRRAACRELYESGAHRRRDTSSAWRQALRLARLGVMPASRRALRRTTELAYAAYFWIAFAVLALASSPLILLPLSRSWKWRIVRTAARTFVGIAGIAFTVTRESCIDERAPPIVVANHASYLDAVFVVAALPWPARFVAKQELARVPVLGTLLRRLDTEFVERFERRASLAGAQRLAQAARAGHTLIFFPEGTFTRAPGLMPFHLGAFAAAVQAEAPVVPLALCGTRSLLRDEQWLPRRTAVAVHIGAPIAPGAVTRGDDEFRAVVGLRDAAREWIRERCGEPDLANAMPRDAQSQSRADLGPHR